MTKALFDTEWVSEKQLLASKLLPFRRTKLQQAIKEKKFPAPVNPLNTRARKWHVSQIEKWRKEFLETNNIMVN